MKTDLREIRTRRALQQSLMALVMELGYESITVSDVASRAGVARKTFYAHYPNKDSLLIDCITPKLLDIMRNVSETDANTLLVDSKPASYPAFKFVQENADFFRVMLSDCGSAGFYTYILDFLTRSSYQMHQALWRSTTNATLDHHLIAHFLAGALLNSIIWWLKQDCQPSAEMMAYTFSRLAAPGAIEFLGLDDKM